MKGKCYQIILQADAGCNNKTVAIVQPSTDLRKHISLWSTKSVHISARYVFQYSTWDNQKINCQFGCSHSWRIFVLLRFHYAWSVYIFIPFRSAIFFYHIIVWTLWLRVVYSFLDWSSDVSMLTQVLIRWNNVIKYLVLLCSVVVNTKAFISSLSTIIDVLLG